MKLLEEIAHQYPSVYVVFNENLHQIDPQMQQDTSLELAKAIRELEASTAALTSAYDTPSQEPSYAPAPTQPPPISGPPPPQSSQLQAVPPPAAITTVNNGNSNGGVVAYDAESYTSKTSLQCSSGYGTMNSTPAGSEDTIASGGKNCGSLFLDVTFLCFPLNNP